MHYKLGEETTRKPSLIRKFGFPNSPKNSVYMGSTLMECFRPPSIDCLKWIETGWVWCLTKATLCRWDELFPASQNILFVGVMCWASILGVISSQVL